jgi:hypothetical protein
VTLDGSRLGCKYDDRDPIAGTCRNVSLRQSTIRAYIRMGPRAPPKTSLKKDYQDKLRNDPEERRSQPSVTVRHNLQVNTA